MKLEEIKLKNYLKLGLQKIDENHEKYLKILKEIMPTNCSLSFNKNKIDEMLKNRLT